MVWCGLGWYGMVWHVIMYAWMDGMYVCNVCFFLLMYVCMYVCNVVQCNAM